MIFFFGILTVIIAGIHFIFSNNVRWSYRILQWISIWSVRSINKRLSLIFFRNIVVPNIRMIFTMGWCIILFFNLFDSHVGPRVSRLFTRSKVGLRWGFIFILGGTHCDAWDFIKAIFSLHFINKNIKLL